MGIKSLNMNAQRTKKLFRVIGARDTTLVKLSNSSILFFKTTSSEEERTIDSRMLILYIISGLSEGTTSAGGKSAVSDEG